MYGRNFGSLAAVCLVAFFLGCVNAAEEGNVRIVNGEIINIRNAPYIVQLRKYNQPFCGGTLVHPQFVVTAAHCFDQFDFQGLTVVAGANTRTEQGVQRTVVAWNKHPLYTRATMHGDVAILKLNSPMPASDVIKTVNLCSAPVPANQLLHIAGWGDMWHGGQASHELRSISVPIMSQRDCLTKNRYTIAMTKLMICAYPNTRDTCQGDSGGPALYNNELCGIVSFGAKCSPQAGSVYTDVYALRDYIMQTMKSMQ